MMKSKLLLLILFSTTWSWVIGAKVQFEVPVTSLPAAYYRGWGLYHDLDDNQGTVYSVAVTNNNSIRFYHVYDETLMSYMYEFEFIQRGVFNVYIHEINFLPTKDIITYNGSGFCSEKRCFYSVQMSDYYLEEIFEFDLLKNITDVYSKKTYGGGAIVYMEEHYIKTHVTPVCGDGLINGISEQCDDGNLINGDGCDQFCQLEQPTSIACTGTEVDIGIPSYFDYALAHVSNEGLYDIATTAPSAFNYYAASNNGGGYFSPQLVSLTNDSYGIAFVDIDSDGDLDILTAGPNGSIFSPNAVSLNTGGIFGEPVTLYISNETVFYGNKVIGGNFDRDEFNDAIWFTSEQAYVAFGPYSFIPTLSSSSLFSTFPFILPINFTRSGEMNGALSADLDNDGYLDALAALGSFSTGYDGELALLINTSESINLVELSASNTSFFSEDALNPQAISAADFNNDGNTDIAFANNSVLHSGIIIGIRTSEDGATPAYSFSEVYTAASISGLAAGDFDGDGDVDLVVAHNSGNSRLLDGNGDATFTENECTLSAMYTPKVADVNSDGRLDLIYNSGESMKILFAASPTGTSH